jgi:hypothetical protein
MFGYRNRHDWTFLQFATVLMEVILLYLLSALALPNFAAPGVIDLRANYFKHKAWFFGCLILVLLDSLLKTVVIDGVLTGRLDLGFHLIWITTALIAAVTKSAWYHRTILYVSYALILTYIALLFSNLK